MDHSFSDMVVHNIQSNRFERPARRPREPRAARDEWFLPAPKRPRVAASPEAINRLLREVRAGNDDVPSETACAVCLEDYATEETIKAMPVCAHAFHNHCISEWLICPFCRRELPLPTQQDDDELPPPPHDQDGGEEEDEHLARRRAGGGARWFNYYPALAS